MDVFGEDQKTKEAIRKIADSINRKRRQELIQIYGNSSIFKQIGQLKESGIYQKGGKAMKLLARLPIEVDIFFTKIYGKDYFKEEDFFDKYGSEWLVNERKRHA